MRCLSIVPSLEPRLQILRVRRSTSKKEGTFHCTSSELGVRTHSKTIEWFVHDAVALRTAHWTLHHHPSRPSSSVAKSSITQPCSSKRAHRLTFTINVHDFYPISRNHARSLPQIHSSVDVLRTTTLHGFPSLSDARVVDKLPSLGTVK